MNNDGTDESRSAVDQYVSHTAFHPHWGVRRKEI
jgi:hypothetical protein